MKTREQVMERFRKIWLRSPKTHHQRFIWSLLIALSSILLDIREELSSIKLILKRGSK